MPGPIVVCDGLAYLASAYDYTLVNIADRILRIQDGVVTEL